MLSNLNLYKSNSIYSFQWTFMNVKDGMYNGNNNDAKKMIDNLKQIIELNTKGKKCIIDNIARKAFIKNTVNDS